MTALIAVLLAAGAGVASAFVPLVNAEAYGMIAAARAPVATAPALVPAVGAGGEHRRALGKLVLHASARRGAARFAHRVRTGRWTARVSRWMGSPTTGGTTVLAAAGLGLPPLAVVSLAAGAAGMPGRRFAGLCRAGRSVRFAALMLPVAWFA